LPASLALARAKDRGEQSPDEVPFLETLFYWIEEETTRQKCRCWKLLGCLFSVVYDAFGGLNERSKRGENSRKNVKRFVRFDDALRVIKGRPSGAALPRTKIKRAGSMPFVFQGRRDEL
jgi:hypothetical protein